MHSQRCYVSVTILDDNIYAMGGFDNYWRLNTAERYEPERNQWTRIAPMHQKRSDASATSLHGKVSSQRGHGKQRRVQRGEQDKKPNTPVCSTTQWASACPLVQHTLQWGPSRSAAPYWATHPMNSSCSPVDTQVEERSCGSREGANAPFDVRNRMK